jgi:hypothetical protein
MPSTYTPIATTTGTGSSASVTFSSIPATYTDLVLIVSGTLVSGGDSGVELRFNGTSPSSSSYSGTTIGGDGSSASSSRQSNVAACNSGLISSTAVGNSIIHIMNYANTTTYKTVLGRGNLPHLLTRATVYLWRDTPAAINQVQVLAGGNFSTSTTFTLYGVKSA